MSKRSQPSKDGDGTGRPDRSQIHKTTDRSPALSEPTDIPTLLLDEGALTRFSYGWAQGHGDESRPLRRTRAPPPLPSLGGGGSSGTPTKAPPRPKWRKWQHIPDVKVWEAVALSIDIEPESEWFSEGKWIANKDSQKYRLFRERITVATRNNALTRKWLNLVDPTLHGVSLGDFANWANDLRWTIPPELTEIGTRMTERQKTGAGSVDYTYWRSLDLWTLVEGAFLLARLEPQKDEKIDDDGSLQGKNYRRIKDAVTLGKIPKHDSRTGRIGSALIRPKDCVAWAKKSGISVPSELDDLSDNDDRDELEGKERTSALKLIIGMAIACYKYDPYAAKSTVPAAIAKDLDTLGIGITAETVKEWLNKSIPHLPRRKTTRK